MKAKLVKGIRIIDPKTKKRVYVSDGDGIQIMAEQGQTDAQGNDTYSVVLKPIKLGLVIEEHLKSVLVEKPNIVLKRYDRVKIFAGTGIINRGPDGVIIDITVKVQ